jgi:hypothetical protein
MATLPIQDPALDVIGSIRTFGPYGPMYEVTGMAPPNEDGEPMVSLLVIESGETLDYELEAVLEDPLKP